MRTICRELTCHQGIEIEWLEQHRAVAGIQQGDHETCQRLVGSSRHHDIVLRGQKDEPIAG